MEIRHPASSQAGSQPESHKKPKSQSETHVDRGTEQETVPPVAAPPMATDTISRGRRKKQGEPASASEGASGGPDAPLVITKVDEAEESSAGHLGGSSAADIQTVDA